MSQTPSDYDQDPDRYRAGMRLATSQTAGGQSVYHLAAGELHHLGAGRILDIGCGEGVLQRAVGEHVICLDRSLVLLRQVVSRAVAGDARALPFRAEMFDAAVSINVLDHLDDPRPALVEAHRVLRPGGTFIAGTISRSDSPELADVWTPSSTPFDTENAPALVAEVFENVRINAWDAPIVTLPDRVAVRDYLMVRSVPEGDAERAAARVTTPIVVTKRGALVSARKG